MVLLPVFTPKQLAGVLLLISFSVIVHIWYAYYILEFANDVSNFLTIANGRFRRNLPVVSVGQDIKFVLLWKSEWLAKAYLTKLNCVVQNCIFTENKRLLRDYTSFDAIIFSESILESDTKRPLLRSSSQLYVFASLESQVTYPACELHNDNFFNWTMTYRLDSTVLWLFFVVRNLTGSVIAPSIKPVWEKNDRPVASPLKSLLLKKTKAAAWIVSNCNANSERAAYMVSLQEHLYHFSLNVDVYGKCSGIICPNDNCNDLIKQDYYFYIAFENSLAKDYVTEKVLHGFDNHAVPIVYGGANYSRFLPPGSYLNAMHLHPYNLAQKMKQIIDDPELYENYFKWTNLYTIDSDPMKINPLCNFCEALNEEKAKSSPAMADFRLWRNGGRDGMKWCLKERYLNDTHIRPGQLYSPTLATMPDNYKTNQKLKKQQKHKTRNTNTTTYIQL
ncbi:alpha-(1,3)-fucosyltransferase C-like [Pectinophora gossypiella]|uniref:alpha-(1,3)-fucosyltransferase C-like n=1 Tax=Pectinophora gossypiella TaxID=13191 RepID=UPI00214E9A2A|nr:alpha-(1,3)-fucosyltransferase C-like [Pectinophora gossypiella]